MRVITGEICTTRGVSDAMADNETFSKEVTDALNKYITGEWGDTDPEDKALNDRAQQEGSRIVAKYSTSVAPILS